VFAESAAQDELLDPLHPVTYTNQTVATMVAGVIAGTRYQMGNVEWAGTGTMSWTWGDTRWKALQDIAAYFGLEIVTRVELGAGNAIAGRYVDLVVSRGMETNKFLEYRKDIAGMKRTGDSGQLFTAVYGVGKSKANGTFVTFAETVWTTPTNPVAKPADQDWVGDPDALQLYGIPLADGSKKHRFYVFQDPDEEDAARLLTRAHEDLQTKVIPGYAYECDAVALERMPEQEPGAGAYEHERMRLGDLVVTRDLDFEPMLTWSARVYEVQRCYSDMRKDRIVVGFRRRKQVSSLDAARKLERRVFSREGLWSGYTG
jgi:phage minor structural protein